MPKPSNSRKRKLKKPSPFALVASSKEKSSSEPERHYYGKNSVLCDTDSRGHATPGGRSPLEIVLDASEGFIPLWAQGVTLRWRFQERSLDIFRDPEQAKASTRELLAKALLAWGDAAPVKFSERDDFWDFELVFREHDRCRPNGCVLASAFFPDAGRHELKVYPKMFEQSAKEQVDTFIHELGHVFGLRHFFAEVSEKAWPSVVFGEHKPFSIMNYGPKSTLTDDDTSDLKKLYKLAWSGTLTEVNGTPIKLMLPFSRTNNPSSLVA